MTNKLKDMPTVLCAQVFTWFWIEFSSSLVLQICYLLSAEQGSAGTHPEMLTPFPISQCISRWWRVASLICPVEIWLSLHLWSPLPSYYRIDQIAFFKEGIYHFHKFHSSSILLVAHSTVLHHCGRVQVAQDWCLGLPDGQPLNWQIHLHITRHESIKYFP
jgi:hypothetical protein